MAEMQKRFGIIGGNGWLGNAMADAAVATGFVDSALLMLSSRSSNRGRVEIAGVQWTNDNAELAAASDVIVLSVRPEQFEEIAIDARDKLVVSVMAWVPAAKIAARTNTTRVIRTMPNAASTIRKSFTPWFASAAVSSDDRQLVQKFLESFGDGAAVDREEQLDYCTGLTGGGAAFPAMLAQAMATHAVAQGLSPDFARRAAEGVVAHASQLLAGRDPQEILDELSSYRGTTAAAIEATLRAGLAKTVAAGLTAAALKSETMTKSQRDA